VLLKAESDHIVQGFIQSVLKISNNETAQTSLGRLFECLTVLMMKRFVLIPIWSLFYFKIS